jgi:predicted ATPase
VRYNVPKCRVAVTGAQGVGKTTLARDLFAICRARTGVSCEILEGIGHRVKEAGYPLGSAATSGTVYAFAAEHLRRERTCLAELVIQDRCLIDLLAYVRVLGLLEEPALRMLQEATLTSLEGIDLILFVPMCDALRDTGTAVETPEFRARIDAAIPAVAQELGVQIVAVEGEPAERAAKAFSLVAEGAHGIAFDGLGV